MSDIGTTRQTGLRLLRRQGVRTSSRSGELGLAIGIMAILVVLILPLPTWLLDVALAFSLSFSILILMTAVFIQQAAGIQLLPHHPADHHHAAAGAEPGLAPA